MFIDKKDFKLLRLLRKACDKIWPYKASSYFRLITSKQGNDRLGGHPDFVIIAPEDYMVRSHMASGIINEEGDLLLHTVRQYRSQVEEELEEGKMLAPGVWEAISSRGARIVYVDIVYRSSR